MNIIAKAMTCKVEGRNGTDLPVTALHGRRAQMSPIVSRLGQEMAALRHAAAGEHIASLQCEEICHMPTLT